MQMIGLYRDPHGEKIFETVGSTIETTTTNVQTTESNGPTSFEENATRREICNNDRQVR